MIFECHIKQWSTSGTTRRIGAWRAISHQASISPTTHARLSKPRISYHLLIRIAVGSTSTSRFEDKVVRIARGWLCSEIHNICILTRTGAGETVVSGIQELAPLWAKIILDSITLSILNTVALKILFPPRNGGWVLGSKSEPTLR